MKTELMRNVLRVAGCVFGLLLAMPAGAQTVPGTATVILPLRTASGQASSRAITVAPVSVPLTDMTNIWWGAPQVYYSTNTVAGWATNAAVMQLVPDSYSMSVAGVPGLLTMTVATNHVGHTNWAATLSPSAQTVGYANLTYVTQTNTYVINVTNQTTTVVTNLYWITNSTGALPGNVLTNSQQGVNLGGTFADAVSSMGMRMGNNSLTLGRSDSPQVTLYTDGSAVWQVLFSGTLPVYSSSGFKGGNFQAIGTPGFTGDASAATGINPSALTGSGTLPVAALPSVVATNGGTISGQAYQFVNSAQNIAQTISYSNYVFLEAQTVTGCPAAPHFLVLDLTGTNSPAATGVYTNTSYGGAGPPCTNFYSGPNGYGIIASTNGVFHLIITNSAGAWVARMSVPTALYQTNTGAGAFGMGGANIMVSLPSQTNVIALTNYTFNGDWLFNGRVQKGGIDMGLMPPTAYVHPGGTYVVRGVTNKSAASTTCGIQECCDALIWSATNNPTSLDNIGGTIVFAPGLYPASTTIYPFRAARGQQSGAITFAGPGDNACTILNVSAGTNDLVNVGDAGTGPTFVTFNMRDMALSATNNVPAFLLDLKSQVGTNSTCQIYNADIERCLFCMGSGTNVSVASGLGTYPPNALFGVRVDGMITSLINIHNCTFSGVRGVSWSCDHGKLENNIFMYSDASMGWPTNSPYAASAAIYILDAQNADGTWSFGGGNYDYQIKYNTFVNAVAHYFIHVQNPREPWTIEDDAVESDWCLAVITDSSVAVGTKVRFLNPRGMGLFLSISPGYSGVPFLMATNLPRAAAVPNANFTNNFSLSLAAGCTPAPSYALTLDCPNGTPANPGVATNSSGIGYGGQVYSGGGFVGSGAAVSNLNALNIVATNAPATGNALRFNGTRFYWGN